MAATLISGKQSGKVVSACVYVSKLCRSFQQLHVLNAHDYFEQCGNAPWLHCANLARTLPVLKNMIISDDIIGPSSGGHVSK